MWLTTYVGIYISRDYNTQLNIYQDLCGSQLMQAYKSPVPPTLQGIFVNTYMAINEAMQKRSYSLFYLEYLL